MGVLFALWGITIVLVGDFGRASVEDKALLDVESWKCETEGNHIYLRGEVKNISDSSFTNLMVVATFRSKDKTVVKSQNSLVEEDPLLPGQTSPFKVMTRVDPEISECSLTFKILGGGKIPMLSKGKPKPPPAKE